MDMNIWSYGFLGIILIEAMGALFKIQSSKKP